MTTEKKQFCTNCGAPLEENNKFCPDCGAKVTPAEATSEQQSGSQSAQSTQNTQNNQFTQNTQNTQSTGTQSTQYVNTVPQQSTTGYSAPYTGTYTQPQYNNYSAAPATNTAPVMSIGSYILTFFLLSIPIVGLIMFFVYAFDTTNLNRRNLVIAQFLWGLICSVAAFLLFIVFFSALSELFYSSFGGYSGYYY